MDEQEHKDFLTGIAKEVGKLIVKPANLNRFRQQDRIFWELCKVYCQAGEQDKQAAESDPRLQDKEAGPPEKGWVWYNQELSKTIPKGYWRRPKKDYPPNPINLLYFAKNDIVELMFLPQQRGHQIEKNLPAYYAFLTVIHDSDSYRIDDIKINNGIWSEDEEWVRDILEDELNWQYLRERDAGDRLRAYIELALDHVKADLAEKQAEAKSKRTPGLLTVEGVEILEIPPSIKRMAEGRKIDIWTRPFKCGLGTATDELFSENPEEVAFNQRLMKKDLEVINRAVGSLNMSHIKSFLIQRCNVPDPTNLTWRQILAHLEVYLHSQKAEQPAEPEPDITSAKEEKEKGKTISSVNIQSFHGVLGDVEAENLQIGNHASIQKQPKAEKKDKGMAKIDWLFKKITVWIFKKTWCLIGAIFVALIVAVLVDIFGEFGWLERIKEFFTR